MLDYPVNLEITENGVQQTVYGFCCGDRDRKRLRVSLLMQGRKIELSPYGSACFTAVKPDDTEIAHPCAIEDGDVCYVPAAQTLALPGTLHCQILVYGSDRSVLYAPRFDLIVDEAEIENDPAVSTDDIALLPIHVLQELDDANGTLLYRDAFAGKIEAAQTFADLPTGCTGQLAYVRNADNAHSRGFYRFGTQWEPLTTDIHIHANQALLDALQIQNGALHCGGRAVGCMWIVPTLSQVSGPAPDGQLVFVQASGQLMYHQNGNWYIVFSTQSIHQHANQSVLNRIGADTNGYMTFDGERIRGSADDEDDTFVPLELGTAYASLQLRENWADVPVYVTETTGYSIALFTSADLNTADYISLVEEQDSLTGLPTPMLRVKRGDTTRFCVPRAFHGLLDDYAPGWYDDEGNAAAAPPLSGMTFAMLRVCLDDYAASDDLPPEAQSALESLSRMVNVSAAAMGGLGVRAGKAQRFTGTLDANRRYAFSPERHTTLTFPQTVWDDEPCSIRMDLTCGTDITLTLPREKLLDGGVLPNTKRGYHTLDLTYIPAAGKWSVGSVDRVVPQVWDDIPDEVTPFGDCTWAQIKAIATHGYKNRLGQWCIRRNNAEEVWFEIGDEKTITLSTGETWVLQIWDFDHDDLADGSGKAPFTIGMKDVSTNVYSMNTTATNAGGWEVCYFRTQTLPAIAATLPETLRAVLSPVTKISNAGGGSNVYVYVNTADTLFMPSRSEIMGQGSGAPAEGSQYAIHVSNRRGAGSWTRTAQGSDSFSAVHSSGDVTNYTSAPANVACVARLAFCV